MIQKERYLVFKMEKLHGIILIMHIFMIVPQASSEQSTKTCPDGWRDASSVDNLGFGGGKDYEWNDCDCNDDMYGGLPIYAICQLN
jgi:hypothetical protein